MKWLRRFFSSQDILPPPDRSVKRNAQILLEQQEYIFRMLRES